MKKSKKITTRKSTVAKKRNVLSRLFKRSNAKRNVGMLNKEIKRATIMLLVVLAIVAVGVFVKTFPNDFFTSQTTNKTTADALKIEAIKSLHSNPTKAKSLLQQALAQYKSIHDTNNVVDVNSQLYLIDHTTKK